MRTNKEQINATLKAFGDEMHAARNYTSPDLTHEGLSKHRERLVEQVRAKYGKEVAAHRSSLYIDRDRSAFDRYRPKLDWNNTGQVAKAQAKWDAVQTKLDAGIGIGQIIETADATTLAAINEFWSDHAEVMKAKSEDLMQPHEAPDTTFVQRAVEDRAADLSGHTGRNALAKSRQSAGLHAYAEVTLNRLEQAVSGQTNGVSDLQTALEANHAEQMASSGGIGLIANHGPSDSAETSAEPAVSE